MIYSYKKIVILEPPVREKRLNTSKAKEQLRSALGENPEQKDLDAISNKFVNLGEVDGRCYMSIPDDVDIGPQDPECDVRKELNLDPAIRLKLLTSADYASSKRYVTFLDEVEHKHDLNIATIQNFVKLYGIIADLNEVISKLVQASPAMIPVGGDDRMLSGKEIVDPHLETVKKIQALNSELTNELTRLGL